MQCFIRDQANTGWEFFDNPLAVLIATKAEEVRSVLDQVETATQQGYQCVGYVAYEAASALDTSLAVHPSTQPLAVFGIFTSCQRLTTLPSNKPSAVWLRPVMSCEQYSSKIQAIKTLLAHGESYQVNLTHTLQGTYEGEPLDLFATLYDAQPTAYAAFLQLNDLAIASVSPELFFCLDGDQITTQPMKGTAPRAVNAEEDLANKHALESSEKDRSENIMIVDMIRNDLGRICQPGTITADNLFAIESLPTVWQQTSSVSGKTEARFSDILSTLFPCASITGAPKMRTMEIINALEDDARGVYTGCIGVLKPDRSMRFSVAIRTLVLDTDTRSASYGIGGGIVWDSAPLSEWQESLDKSKLLNGVSPMLLETMKYDPRDGVVLLDRHINRLVDAANTHAYPLNPTQAKELVQCFSATEKRKLRLLADRSGRLSLESNDFPPIKTVFRLGLADAPIQREDFRLRTKTTQRTLYDQNRGARLDIDDVILFNEDNEITETTIFNLYLKIQGVLYTPALPSGLLPGVYREHLLALGAAKERVLSVQDLSKAEGLYVSNAVRGLCPAILVPLN
ncbi:aminodeoxychorismate synthase component I [Pseudomonadales bacterium]|nr:aminodeoxychorismate synthase component I [Pseudomonadales bacterium]